MKVMKILEMKKMMKKDKTKNQNKKENKKNQNQKERMPSNQEKLKKSQNAKTNDLSGFILYSIYLLKFYKMLNFDCKHKINIIIIYSDDKIG